MLFHEIVPFEQGAGLPAPWFEGGRGQGGTDSSLVTNYRPPESQGQKQGLRYSSRKLSRTERPYGKYLAS